MPLPCLSPGHECPQHVPPRQCRWRRTLPPLGTTTDFQLLSYFCCVYLDVSKDTAITDLPQLLVPEEFPESRRLPSVRVSRSQTQQFWVNVIFLVWEQPRGRCLGSRVHICVLELPRCHSFSWSTTWSTKAREVASASHVWDAQVVLRRLLSCRVLMSQALRRPGNAAVALCLSAGLQSAEHPWIALPGSVRAPSMPSLGLASPTIEEPADRGKPNPPLSPQTLHLFVELPFFLTPTVDKERLAENFTKRCNLV